MKLCRFGKKANNFGKYFNDRNNPTKTIKISISLGFNLNLTVSFFLLVNKLSINHKKNKQNIIISSNLIILLTYNISICPN